MQINLPDNLMTDDAPVELTESLRMAKAAEVLTKYQDGRRPEEMMELAQNPRILAEVEAETFLETAQLGECAGRALVYQTVRMAESGWHRYHVSEPDTVEEHLRNLLDQAHVGSSTWYNLRALVRVVIPWSKANGKAELLGSLWREDTIAKTRILADRAGHLFQTKANDPGAETNAAQEVLNTQTFNQVTSMLEDLGNQEIGVQLYSERYKAPMPRSGMQPIEGYTYIRGNGKVMVLLCPDASQVAYVERVLGTKADWHLGEGREEFLDGLVARKGIA
jgi:hypothetical protein